MNTTTRWAAGDYISWDLPHVGTATVRITGVDKSSITYESTDGVTEAFEESCYRTLDQVMAGRWPATAEEIADFERRYTPPPQNWE